MVTYKMDIIIIGGSSELRFLEQIKADLLANNMNHTCHIIDVEKDFVPSELLSKVQTKTSFPVPIPELKYIYFKEGKKMPQSYNSKSKRLFHY